MYRKFIPSLAVLIILGTILSACGGGAVETVIVEVEVPAEGAPAPAEEGILTRVLERGKIICGGRTDLAGFGMLDADGRNYGFMISEDRLIGIHIHCFFCSLLPVKMGGLLFGGKP